MNKHNEYIDFCKGFLMFAVVVGHVVGVCSEIPENHPLYIWIYSFHMPCFLFISGYLSVSSLKKNLSETLKKKSTRLLIPALIWTSIHFIFNNYLLHVRGYSMMLSLHDFYTEARWCWYLYTLFVFIIVSTVFHKSKYRIAIYLLITIVLLAVNPYMPIDILIHFSIAQFWPAFILGVIAKEFTPPYGQRELA